MEHMYELKNTDTIISPSLIYYEEIIRENIKKAMTDSRKPRTAVAPCKEPQIQGYGADADGVRHYKV